MQNIKVNRKIYKDLKSKEHLLHPYAARTKDAPNYNQKMYMEISKSYANYLKFYVNVANATDILAKPIAKISDDVRELRTADILKNYEFFKALVEQIFVQFQNANFCRLNRLFSNLIFMLFKDLIKVYKVYYVHITEILERFHTLDYEVSHKAFVMFQNFVNLTDSIRTKANKILYTFNFPIALPDFYNPDKSLVESLKVVVESNNQDDVKEIASRARGGMNREQFVQGGATSSKKQESNNEDGEKEYYFDCTVLEKLATNQSQAPCEEMKTEVKVDLMDFIRQQSFSTVKGPDAPAQNPQSDVEFDFEQFNTNGPAK